MTGMNRHPIRVMNMLKVMKMTLMPSPWLRTVLERILTKIINPMRAWCPWGRSAKYYPRAYASAGSNLTRR